MDLAIALLLLIVVAGREVYVGAENLRQRVPRSQLDLPAERHRV